MENITNEVVENMDEVIFVAEQITPKTNTGLKVAGGAAVVTAVGFVIYKGVQWIKAKKKAKKEQEEIEANCEPCDACEDEE